VARTGRPLYRRLAAGSATESTPIGEPQPPPVRAPRPGARRSRRFLVRKCSNQRKGSCWFKPQTGSLAPYPAHFSLAQLTVNIQPTANRRRNLTKPKTHGMSFLCPSFGSGPWIRGGFGLGVRPSALSLGFLPSTGSLTYSVARRPSERFFRTADFQVCRIAGFPTRRPFANLARPIRGQARRWGNRRSSRLKNLRSAHTRCL